MKANVKHEHFVDVLNVLDSFSEPTEEDLSNVKEVATDAFEMVWCGGSPTKGCGKHFNFLRAKIENGLFICPYCGRGV